jgi:hypothetical protein
MMPNDSTLKMMLDSLDRQAFISKLDLRSVLRKIYNGYFKEVPGMFSGFGFDEFFQWALASGFVKQCITKEGEEIYAIFMR